MIEISGDTYKILRKLIPYGHDYSDMKFEFHNERFGRTYEISVGHHPRGGILLRSTEKGVKSATHLFFGIITPNRTTILLRSFSMAIQGPRSFEQGFPGEWEVSTESGLPKFPDFSAMGIDNWKSTRMSKQDGLIVGVNRLTDLMDELYTLMEKDRSR